MNETEVIIIGAGPAGVSCALSLKLFGIDFIIFEKEKVGGLLRNAHQVQNYPGFSRGLAGSELAKAMECQLIESGIEVRKEEVLCADFSEKGFIVETNKDKYSCNFLVVASGTVPRKADIPGLDSIIVERVFYEVKYMSDIEGGTIIIVGAGDAAFDYALSLRERNRVYIFNRSNAIKANYSLRNRVLSDKRIEYVGNVSIENLNFKNGLIEVKARIKEKDKPLEKVYHCDYILFAIGREPNLDFIGESLKYKVTQLEKVGVLFLIGDVKNGKYRQASIAVGDGTLCAMKIKEKIENESGR